MPVDEALSGNQEERGVSNVQRSNNSAQIRQAFVKLGRKPWKFSGQPLKHSTANILVLKLTFLADSTSLS